MVRNNMRFALLTTTVIAGYDWKMDGDKLATDDAGNPVWVDSGGEKIVRGETISRLSGETKEYRQRAERAETALAKFDGIDDPDAARMALDTIGKLDQKKLIDAGKVDEVRNEVTKQLEGRITKAEQERDAANQRADATLLDSAFNGSEFARERLAVPVEMVRATFGNRFKVENGKIVAHDANGQPIYSDKHVGEIASFDEALEKTLNGYKYKDTILKAPDAGGSGSGGAGGNRGKGRTVTRAQFEEMTPQQQAEFAGKMGTGEASIAE